MILEAPITEWHGSFFVRSGPFVGSVLKFTVEFSSSYPCSQDSFCDSAFPEIIFQQFETHKMWHPFIDELMGFLDLTSVKKKYRNKLSKESEPDNKENINEPLFLMAEIL